MSLKDEGTLRMLSTAAVHLDVCHWGLIDSCVITSVGKRQELVLMTLSPPKGGKMPQI